MLACVIRDEPPHEGHYVLRRAERRYQGSARTSVGHSDLARLGDVDFNRFVLDLHANDATRALVLNPDFRAELEAVPSKSPGKAEHQLFWAVQKGRDQAAPVLIHRILYREDDGEIFVERRFYSGYDYDSLQVVTGVLPTPDGGCAVFYTNHTYTAQVAGFGGGAKRSIGRKLLEKELVGELERAQRVVSGS